MFAGGDQNSYATLAQRYFCGGAYISNWDPVTEGQNSPTVDLCNQMVSAELSAAYGAISGEEATTNLDRYVQMWYAYPYDACILVDANPNQNGVQNVYSSGLNATTGPGATQCMSDYANGQRQIEIGDLKFDVFGENGFLRWAVEMVKAGISASDVSDLVDPNMIPVPQVVMDAINELTGGDPRLNQQIIRLYREAMMQRPAEERMDIAIQEKVGMSVVNEAKEIKQANEDFARALYMSYVDNVLKVGNEFEVNVIQIPENLLTELNVTNNYAIDHVRRLFVQVEDQIKNDEQVAAHIATLDQTARTEFLTPIREEIVTDIIPAISAKIEGKEQNEIASILNHYDAVAELKIENNGASVEIIKIELVEREVSDVDVPEMLLEGTHARDSIIRYGAVVRIWQETVELEPAAAEPGELQNGLVMDLISQLADKPDDELSMTYVVGVDPEMMHVTLDQAPTALIDPINPQAGDRDIRAEVLRLFREFLDMLQSQNPDQPVDEEALAVAIRAMIRPILLQNGGVFRLDDLTASSASVDENGIFHLEMSERGSTGGGVAVAVADGNGKLTLLFDGAATVIPYDQFDGGGFADFGFMYQHAFSDTISLQVGAIADLARDFAFFQQGADYHAFENWNREDWSAVVKYVPLALTFNWGDDVEHAIRLETLQAYVRHLTMLDYGNYGDMPYPFSTRDVYGASNRSLGLLARYGAQWDNGSAIYVQAFGAAAKTYMPLYEGWDVSGGNIGGAIGGQVAAGDHVMLMLVLGGNYVVSGTTDGSYGFTGEAGAQFNINDNHSIGLALRFEQNHGYSASSTNFGDGIDSRQWTPALNYHGMLGTTGNNTQHHLNLNVMYYLNQSNMDLGNDFGNACVTPSGDVEPCDMSSSIGNTAIAGAVQYRAVFNTGWYVGGQVLGIGSGQDSSIDGFDVGLQFLTGIQYDWITGGND